MCSRPRRSMTRARTDCGMDSVCIEGSPREDGTRLSRRDWRRATVPLPGKGVGDEGMGERITVAGGGLVVDGAAGRVGLWIGEGVVHVAEREQCPACPGIRHLRLECVPLGLRRDWVGGAMHGK